MPFKLLIADSDTSYAEHLSNILIRDYVDTYEVDIFTEQTGLLNQLANRAYDVALLDVKLLELTTSLNTVRLPILLIDSGQSAIIPSPFEKLDCIHRYQRISSINSEILDKLARVTPNGIRIGNQNKARITSVFSATGGCGKSSVAVAFAMRMAAQGKKALYFNLESFCGTHAFFPQKGKGISYILQNMGSDNSANLSMLLTASKQVDSQSGVMYFSMPDNYDDISIIDNDELQVLINAVSSNEVCDELIIDLSSNYGTMCKKVLEMSHHVLLITEPSPIAASKLEQFFTQHNLFKNNLSKCALLINKAHNTHSPESYKNDRVSICQILPSIKSSEPIAISKALSMQSLPFTN